MNEKKIINKIACDINGKKLGRIIKIEKIMQRELKEGITQIYIQKKFMLRTTLQVHLDAKEILNVDKNNVIINITKVEFDSIVKQAIAYRKHMIDSAKLSEASATDKASAMSFSWGKI
ncbi:MAG TPA: hypothetical protein VMX55_00395 [candidate division Zixibacteria bacterium]|nr:hypothetical protein [candidate division Zixibacteria bacterium]